MLIDSFLNYLLLERNYSEKTIVNYKKDLEEFEAFFEQEDSECNWATVDSDLVRGWAVSLMKPPVNCKTTSVNRKLSALRSFFRYLLSEKKIEKNPMSKVKGPKNRKALPYFVKDNQMEEIIDKEDFGKGFIACRNKLIIEILYETGIRRAELVSLNDLDVDLASRTVKVIGKRNKQRIIPFGQELCDEISAYKNIRNNSITKCSESFFVSSTGKRLCAGSVYTIVKNILSKVVTLKKCSPHVLRHTFATSMLNNHSTLVAVKELLGHKSLSTTTIYTNTTFEELKKIYKQAHPRA